MTKKVEILLATYNGERYLREQLDSIVSQYYEHWLVRACDDASTDSTYEILCEYQNRYPDKFVIERNKVGFGSAKKNFMHLMKQSSCEYVMCCDQDDVWLPDKISRTLQKMKDVEQNNMPVLIHTDLKVADDNLQIISESFFAHSNFRKQFGLHEVLIQNFVTGCTMMMNRALVELMKQIEDTEGILMHDWAAAILATAFGRVGFVDTATMLYRQHAVNSVGAKKYGLALFIEKIKGTGMKQSLMDTTMQAREIAGVFRGRFDDNTSQLIEGYAMLWNRNKIQRLQFYRKHGVWKKGLPRKICQVIIG